MAEERIQKVMADQGLCSRRAAEQVIREGRVKLNGHPVKVGDKMDIHHDVLMVDGEKIRIVKKQQKYYIMLHKPRGYITTVSDELGRKTVMDLVQDVPARIFPVGRLDKDSEGLLLMTNDGALMQRLIHPSGEIDKVYQVSVYGPVRGCAVRLASLTDLEGEPIRPARVEVLRQTEQTAELSVTIHEGKNRQIRRMCAACGLTVKRLRRVREHTLELGDLPAGKWRYLTQEEVKALQEG